MSPSERRIPLVASTSDDAVEIHLIDGHFNRVAEGVGTLTTSVSPGVYKVKYKAGSLVHEEPLFVGADQRRVDVPVPDLYFSSSAPIASTKTSREYHLDSSARLSRTTHATIGAGAWVFVFVRDLDGRGRVTPARGLTLCSLDGDPVVDFESVAEHGPTADSPDTNNWAGANIQLDPGFYRLAADTGEVGVLEQLLAVPPDWQMQVFLTRQSFGDGSSGRRPLLADASIHLRPPYMGFNPGEQASRDAELARQALANHRPEAVPKESLRWLLDEKFGNPMLGIYAAYLLTMQDNPNAKLLGIVMSNLRQLIGEDHPDYQALQIRRAHLGLRKTRPNRIEIPPMLRAGWEAVVDESATNHELVPADSLAGRIADRVWGGGPWLVWQRPPETTEAPPTLDEMGEMAADLVSRVSDPGAIADSLMARLTPMESAVLQMLRTPAIGPADDPEPSFATRSATELGVPPTVAAVAVRTLHRKVLGTG